MKEEHLEALVKSKYHADGACVVRHPSARNEACKYEKNGYDITVAARKAFYDAPRYDPAALKGIKRKAMFRKSGGRRIRLLTPNISEDGRQPIWNVGYAADGSNPNFLPKGEGGAGFHYPYLHNWHHMIANEMLNEHLKDAKVGLKLLEVLLASGYNINGKPNIVLIPKQEQVGKIIGWPIHPNNHGAYDAYVESKLGQLKNRLRAGLEEKKKPHKITVQSVGGVASDLDATSNHLFKLLSSMKAGVHINKLADYAKEIERKLKKR